MKHTRQDLNIMQGWSLEKKIKVSQMKILEWYREYNGQVFTSFSGGKDSTVLLDLKNMQACFVLHTHCMAKLLLKNYI